jgi:hypothetical protein
MSRAALCFLILFGAAIPAWARPPQLRSVEPVPARLRQGERAAARLEYADPDGDRPQEAWMVLEGGGQAQRVPADLRPMEKRYREGVPITWSIGPLAPGSYRLHFEAASIDGRARLPQQGELSLVVESMLTKWLLLGAGMLLALAVLPGVVFVGARRAADPAGAARTGFSVGMLAAYLWFLWLFAPVYSLPVFVIVGAAALGVTVWLSRRRKL